MINQAPDELAATLRRIERKLALVATTAQIEEEFGRINAATSDIAADITELMNKPDVPDAVRDAAAVIATRLEGIASAHPPVPVPPEDPPPGSRPLPA